MDIDRETKSLMLNIWRWWQVDPFLGWMHYIGTKKSRVCSWAARKSCLWSVSRSMRETVIIFLWVTKPTKYQCNTKNPLPFFWLSNMTHGNVLWCFSFHLIHMFSDHSMFHGLVTTPISEVRIEDMEYYTSVWCIFFILVLTFWWLWSCQRKPICPTSCFLFTSLEKL